MVSDNSIKEAAIRHKVHRILPNAHRHNEGFDYLSRAVSFILHLRRQSMARKTQDHDHNGLQLRGMTEFVPS